MASLGIEVNDSVVQELIVVQAAEVMLSQLHDIHLPSERVHTPHTLRHSHQPRHRCITGVPCLQGCNTGSVLWCYVLGAAQVVVMLIITLWDAVNRESMTPARLYARQ